MRITNYLLPIITYTLVLSGCATAPYIQPARVTTIVSAASGTYHKVGKGQTLWRISKLYGIDVDELAQANHLSDNSKLEVGQQLFIPNRTQPQIKPVMQFNNNDDFVWPVRGRVIASFGQTVNNMLNKGINIEPGSSTNVIASRSGRVVFLSDNFAGMGKTIIIDHGDGLFTVYARNRDAYVRCGDTVQQGASIAQAGSFGRDPRRYLHFEIRKGHTPKNPLYYLL